MCIYLGEQPHLHYDSAEHIIPAGLGGMQRLPLDYVSREFNHSSSKQERAFMQSSIIALPRQILGPGKRGSLNPTRATKSRVNVFSKQPDEEAFSLGYIQRGKPYELPYIAWNAERDEFTISIPKGATEAEVGQFKRYLETFDEKRARLIAFPQLDSNTYLLGVQPGLEHNVDFYIASHDGHTHAFTQELLDEINSLIADKGTFSEEEKYHIRTHQSALIGVDYYTCCAKIAFNALAYIKGKDFVLQECLDPLREWIVNGGDNRFVEIAPGMLTGMQNYFPADSHYIYFTKSGNALFADVCFYNYFHNTVRLSEKFSGDFSLDGFICDWRGRQELRLHKYITQQAANPDGASA